jgi:hypothetical protein
MDPTEKAFADTSQEIGLQIEKEIPYLTSVSSLYP